MSDAPCQTSASVIGRTAEGSPSSAIAVSPPTSVVWNRGSATSALHAAVETVDDGLPTAMAQNPSDLERQEPGEGLVPVAARLSGSSQHKLELVLLQQPNQGDLLREINVRLLGPGLAFVVEVGWVLA
jgi:hypothetical protein